MRYIMALLLSLALAVPAFAGFEGPNASTGGFAGPGPQTITKAAQVQNALDDTTCTLEGNILERLSKNKYVFQDDSGKITVEIGQRIFGDHGPMLLVPAFVSCMILRFGRRREPVGSSVPASF